MNNKKGTRAPAQQFIKNILPSQKRSTRIRTRNYLNNYSNQFVSCKRSVSPVIATILLIALVVIIALIVFQWMKGFTKEAVTKFDGTNIELVCNDVQFDASYSAGTLTISNSGNVPIYNFDVKTEYPGGHDTINLKENLDFGERLSQGGVFSDSFSIPDSTTKIILIPILLGVNKDGEQKTQACDERQGKEIQITI
ncbi:MAG: hypothetical protein QT10_C0010G0019 [archaeon GW2011_AR19]|nr:MAG: hypothetical protein QT10_C0010G0019 [archaeon GW2011_AR19]